MVKEDPLHILSRTPTKASRNQEWAVWKEAEKNRTREIKQWGTSPTKSPVRRTTTPRKSPAITNRTTTTTRTPQNTTRSSVVAASSQTKSRALDFKKSPKKLPTAKAPSSSKKRPTTVIPTPRSTTADKDETPAPKSIIDAKPAPAALTVDVTQQVITSSKIDLPNKKEGMELFDRLDENASGKLSLAELDKGCVMLFPELNNKPAIMAAYKAADRSGNGFVERKEFGYFLRYLVYYNNLWSLFSSIDDDGDRRITKDEFLDAADKLELERDASEVFAEIDTNGGGMILFDELCHYMSVNHSDWGADDSNVKDVKQRLSSDAHDGKAKKVSNEQEKKPNVVEPVPGVVMKIAIPDKKEGMELFDRLDENASGKLSLAELDKGCVMLFPELNNKPAIMAAYKAADRSSNGFVERKEFGYFLRYLVYYNNLWSLFSSIDDDGDRRISKDEFLEAANKLELERDASEVFAEIDTNGGGMILFDELCHYMSVNHSDWGAADQEDVANVETKPDGTS